MGRRSLSVSGTARATDTDIHIGSGGRDALSFSAATTEDGAYANVVAGRYGTLFLDADGTYECRLNNASPDVQALADGEEREDVFWVRVSDGRGGHDHQPLAVTVRGTDGAPMLSLNDPDGNAGRGASLYVTETDGRDESYTVSGKAAVYDEDGMDQGNLTFSFGDGNHDPADNPTTLYVRADGATGAQAGAGDLGALVMAADGTFTFTGDPDEIAKLKPGEKIVVEATVVVADAHNNTDEAPLKITVTGTNTTPEISFEQAGVTEGDRGDGDVFFTANYETFDADGHDTSVYIKTADGYVTALEGDYGRLPLNGNGTYTYTLHNGRDSVQALNSDGGATDSFNIVVRDEYGAERPETLNVVITGTNDNPVINVGSGSTATPSATDDECYTGHLTVTDVDDATASMTFAAKTGEAGVNGFADADFAAAGAAEAD